MMSQLIVKILFLPVSAVSYLAATAILCGRRLPPRLVGVIAGLGATCFVARALVLRLVPGAGRWGWDFELFWSLGRTFLEGRDPYGPGVRFNQLVIYPPNTPPVMSVFAVFPLQPSYWLFIALNLGVALALGPLAQRAIRESGAQDGPVLTTAELVLLSLAVAYAPVTVLIFDLGHITLLVVACLIAALMCQARGWPLRAGIWLALGSIKPSLSLPFLMLFSRRRDLMSWVSFAVVTLVLCGLTSGFVRLPRQLVAVSASISEASAPGGMNDYSFANRENAESMIGMDHTLYRLGFRDRARIRVIQLGVVGALGIWVFGCVAWGWVGSRGGACGLVALYSTLFLYHRAYDAVILILPMVHAALQARWCPAVPRRWYRVSALACLAALLVPGRLLKWGLVRSIEWGGFGGWLFQALVLPWATWAILIAMVTFWLAERSRGGVVGAWGLQAGPPVGAGGSAEGGFGDARVGAGDGGESAGGVDEERDGV